MALRKSNDQGQYFLSPQSTNIQQYDAQAGPRKAISDSNSMRQYAENAAASSNGRYTANDAKYGLAVKAAQELFKDVDDVDDDRMKQEIDRIYEQELGATNTGKEQRGENTATDILNLAKNGIDSINEGIGGALDATFDAVVGGIAGLFNEQWGQDLKDAFDAKALSIVPDIAFDSLLAMVPGAGIPLVLAKNAIQQSDNIAEAISGKDNVTQDYLEGFQQLGKAGEAVLGTTLAAIPGIGKAANAAKLGKAKKVAQAEHLEDTVSKIAEKQLGDQGTLINEFGMKPIGKNAASKADDAVNALKAPDIPDNKSVGIPEYKPIHTVEIPKEAIHTVEIPKNITNRLEPIKADKKELSAISPKELDLKPTEDALEKFISDNKNRLTKEAKKQLTDELKGLKYTDQVKQAYDKAEGLMKITPGPERDKIASKIDKLKTAKKEAKNSKKRKEIQEAIEELKSQQGSMFPHPIKATRTMVEGLMPKSKAEAYAKLQQKFDPTIPVGAIDKVRNVPFAGGMLSHGLDATRGALMSIGAADLAEMGETGVDPLTAFGQMQQRFANDPASYIMMMAPVGSRGMARRLPSVTGKFGSSIPYNAIRAGAVSDRISDMAQSDIDSSYSEEEMFDRLRSMIDRNNNGV